MTCPITRIRVRDRPHDGSRELRMEMSIRADQMFEALYVPTNCGLDEKFKQVSKQSNYGFLRHRHESMVRMTNIVKPLHQVHQKRYRAWNRGNGSKCRKPSCFNSALIVLPSDVRRIFILPRGLVATYELECSTARVIQHSMDKTRFSAPCPKLCSLMKEVQLYSAAQSHGLCSF